MNIVQASSSASISPQAVLSPKRLGPETQFAPVRIEARTDRRPVKTERVVVSKEAAPKPRRRRT